MCHRPANGEKNTIRFTGKRPSPLSMKEGVVDMCMCEGDKERVSASEHCVMVGICSTAVALAQGGKKEKLKQQTAVYSG